MTPKRKFAKKNKPAPEKNSGNRSVLLTLTFMAVFVAWLAFFIPGYIDRAGKISGTARSSAFANWNVLWIIFALAIIAGYRNFARDPMRNLAIIILLNIGLYVLIYVITPWDPQELIGFTLTRLLIHVAPAAVFICAEQTKYRLIR